MRGHHPVRRDRIGYDSHRAKRLAGFTWRTTVWFDLPLTGRDGKACQRAVGITEIYRRRIALGPSVAPSEKRDLDLHIPALRTTIVFERNGDRAKCR